MLKAIIIDDEIAALRSLELLVEAYCPNVKVVAKGQSVKEGKELVEEHKPDILFLDIEMPHGNGFELLEQLPNFDFEVVFITAYNQYAIKAFKYSAIDYILKPIDIDELVKAVEKVSELRNSKVSPRERYSVLFQNIKEILPKKLVLFSDGEFKYIDLINVLYLNTEENVIRFVMHDGTQKECKNASANYKELVKEKGFVNLNNGNLVNLAKVSKVDKNGKGRIVLEGGLSLSLESIGKDLFIEKLVEFNNQKNQ